MSGICFMNRDDVHHRRVEKPEMLFLVLGVQSFSGGVT